MRVRAGGATLELALVLCGQRAATLVRYAPLMALKASGLETALCRRRDSSIAPRTSLRTAWSVRLRRDASATCSDARDAKRAFRDSRERARGGAGGAARAQSSRYAEQTSRGYSARTMRTGLPRLPITLAKSASPPTSSRRSPRPRQRLQLHDIDLYAEIARPLDRRKNVQAERCELDVMTRTMRAEIECEVP